VPGHDPEKFFIPFGEVATAFNGYDALQFVPVIIAHRSRTGFLRRTGKNPAMQRRGGRIDRLSLPHFSDRPSLTVIDRIGSVILMRDPVQIFAYFLKYGRWFWTSFAREFYRFVIRDSRLFSPAIS
jgi:hypothetical protein